MRLLSQTLPRVISSDIVMRLHAVTSNGKFSARYLFSIFYEKHIVCDIKRQWRHEDEKKGFFVVARLNIKKNITDEKKCNAFSKPSYSLQEMTSIGLAATRQKSVITTINRQTCSHY